MEPPESLADFDRDELRELYMESISHFQYQHKDVWRGQKYYTTLNTAIFGGAITLGRLETVGSLSDIRLLPLFLTGAVTSYVGYKTVKRLRRYYLQAGAKKTAIEYLLGYRKEFSRDEIVETDLAVSWKMEPEAPHGQGEAPKFEDIEDIMTDDWIEANIYKRGGVTFWFINLHLFFLFMNILMVGIILIVNILPLLS